MKRREANLEVGCIILAHLRKERFSKGEYIKFKLKNIGPCKILRIFSTNAHEIEVPTDIGISPIFNVKDMYHYTGNKVDKKTSESESCKDKPIRRLKQLPRTKTMQMERILDKRVMKKTRDKEYYEYLVKWKHCQV